jgi:hypothetical protein
MARQLLNIITVDVVSPLVEVEKGSTGMGGILYTVAVVLIILWVIGFLVAHVVSPVIHLVLVVALIVLAYQFLSGRRRI